MLLTLNLSGCELVVYETKLAARDSYRSIIPETLTTTEEIKTTDGPNVIVHVTSKYYTGRYKYSLESEDYPDWSFESKFRISSDGRELPITFDVIGKIPWIVLPVQSNQCERFGFPREGLIFFKLEDKTWKETHYAQAPVNLKVNLLRNRDAYKNGSGMDRANCEFWSTTGYGGWDFGGYVCRLNPEGAIYVDKDSIQPIKPNYGREVTPTMRQYLDAQIDDRYKDTYILKNGEGKAIKEIAQVNLSLPNIARNTSCYYLNPPIDPDERRSLREYIETQPISIQSKLIRTIDEEVEVSDAQQHKLYTLPKTDDNCAQVIQRNFTARIARENQAEFSNVAGVPSGTFKSPGSAVRVELNTKDGTHSLYLPIKGFSAMDRISAISCPANRVFINFGGSFNELQVMEYDLNAHLLNKWKIAFPEELKKGHTLAEFSVEKDTVSIKLVDWSQILVLNPEL